MGTGTQIPAPGEASARFLQYLQDRHEGTLISASGNRPFLINETNSAWLVLKGKVDLFGLRFRNGEPTGARSHFLRVEAGRVMFGFDFDGAEGIVLMACCAPSTQLLKLPRSRVADLAGRPDHAAAVFDLLDEWIEKVSAASRASGVLPKQYVSLEAEGETGLEDGQAAMPVRRVVWVRHLEGCSYFSGRKDLKPLGQDGFFPVSPFSWLQAAQASRLAVLGTAAFHQQDARWESLDTFHQIALESLALNVAGAVESERARLRQKAETDRLTLKASLFRLAAAVERKWDRRVARADSGGDNLLRACQMVGNNLGLSVRPLKESGMPAHSEKDRLASILQNSGLRFRHILLRGQWWRADNGPLLAFREKGGQPVALIPASPRRYELHDPSDGSVTSLTAGQATSLSPFAVVIYRPLPLRKLTVPDLLLFGARGCSRDVATVVVVGVLSGLLALVVPIATGVIFDTLIPGAQRRLLIELVLVLLVCAVVTTLFDITRSIAMLRVEGKMGSSLQAAVWDRLLSLPVPFFRKFTSGDLAVRALGIDSIRQTLTGTTLSTMFSGIFSLFSIGLLFYYSWRLALVGAGLVVITFAATTLAGYLQVRHERAVTELRGRISGLVLEIISGIAKFRVARTEGRAFAVWAQRFAQQKILAAKNRTITMYLSVFNAGFPVLSSAVIFWMVWYTQGAQMTVGQFLAFNAAFMQLMTAAVAMSSAITSTLGVVPLYERAKPILQTLPEVDRGKSDPGELTGHIEVSRVSFRYTADGPRILHDYSLEVHPGEFVALVGPSGCGKSTLFRILLGFETPESGAVIYDGQDLKGLSVQAARRQIGVVMQNGKLLAGDIFTNIVGSASLTVDDAWEAARLAGFDEDIRQMPMGMHTVISEGGGGISGGQRQRLLIARAIVNRPRILLFDEATSALDNQTQATVSRSLESLQATRVVIAHRLSTVMNADRIVVMDRGSIIQMGTYRELVAQTGLFADLAKRQLTLAESEAAVAGE